MKTPKPKAPVITLKPVVSTMVMSTGYDPVSQTLVIQFRGGKTYHYDKVPTEVVDAMNKAESVGKFIGSHIRGKFETRLIQPQ
jgi:hypothetical protein